MVGGCGWVGVGGGGVGGGGGRGVGEEGEGMGTPFELSNLSPLSICSQLPAKCLSVSLSPHTISLSLYLPLIMLPGRVWAVINPTGIQTILAVSLAIVLLRSS